MLHIFERHSLQEQIRRGATSEAMSRDIERQAGEVETPFDHAADSNTVHGATRKAACAVDGSEQRCYSAIIINRGDEYIVIHNRLQIVPAGNRSRLAVLFRET